MLGVLTYVFSGLKDFVFHKDYVYSLPAHFDDCGRCDSDIMILLAVW